jgi:hypothetical protein
VRGLYAKALPYLREKFAELCKLAGADTPQSWPDTLPFAATLPPDLVTSPAPETPALAQARQAAEAWSAQEAAMAQAQPQDGQQPGAMQPAPMSGQNNGDMMGATAGAQAPYA